MKSHTHRIVYLVLTLLLLPWVASAQNSEPLPEELTLARQLVVILGVSEWKVNVSLKDSSVAENLDRILSTNTHLSDAQKQELKPVLEEAKSRLGKRMDDHMKVLSESKDLVTAAGAKLFVERFSVEELRSLIEFFQTPLGRKASDINFLLSNDIGKVYGNIWLEELGKFSLKLYEEEAELLRKRIAEMKDK